MVSLVALAAPPEPILGPLPTEEYIRDVNAAARRTSIGITNGMWGSAWGSDVHVDVPFGPRVGQFYGARIRAIVVDTSVNPAVAPGLELFGRSPVMMGVLRMYGGGGVHVWIDTVTGDVLPGGGGHMGFEGFVSPNMAFLMEIGGQGSDLVGIGGASFLTGIHFYL